MKPQKSPLLIIAIVWPLVLSGCSVRAFTNDAGGPAPSDRDVAVIYHRWSSCPWCVRRILVAEDGSLVYDIDRDGVANPLKLIPGRYVVELAKSFLSSERSAWGRGTVELLGGHTYTAHATSFLIWDFVASPRVWMEDDTSGQVVVGVK